MFREMRRKNQQLSQDECRQVLDRGSSGVLALLGDGGYPYALPISYVYDGEHIYFHCSRTGHKLDAITREPRCSFCVIDQDQVVPEEYTTYFRSVIVFGQMRVIIDESEKRAAIEKLAVKYAPSDAAENRDAFIQKEWAPLCMLEMNIEHMSGKEARELRAQSK